MARTHSADRLTDAEATAFRKFFRNVMRSKALSFGDVLERLGWDDEQALRNAMKLAPHANGRPRPLLAPTALAIGRAISDASWKRPRTAVEESDMARRLITYWRFPQPEWVRLYNLRRSGPAVHIPHDQVSPFAALIASRIGKSRAARDSIEAAIVAVLRDEWKKFALAWREAASDYAAVIAASAARGEVLWRDVIGQDIVTAVRDAGGNHDVHVVMETLNLLVDMTHKGKRSWQPKPKPKGNTPATRNGRAQNGKR